LRYLPLYTWPPPGNTIADIAAFFGDFTFTESGSWEKQIDISSTPII